MKELKKYMDIVRYGKPQTVEVLTPGDRISITEKIDGANASFIRDDDCESPKGVSAFSRKKRVQYDNTLQGYYDWVVKNIVPIKEKLVPTYRYVGEWLVPHKVAYKEEYYHNFYLFSIWDEETEEYLPDDLVIFEAERLGLNVVPFFYIGEFKDYDQLTQYIGKSTMTLRPDEGEGIVVKNPKYKNCNQEQCFVKLVSERFAEIQKQKLPKNPNIYEKERALIKTVLTKPRVDKIMLKQVDEGVLTREDFIIEKMGLLIKTLSPLVYEDMIKEESDILKDIEESVLRKQIGRILPLTIKEVLKDYGGM